MDFALLFAYAVAIIVLIGVVYKAAKIVLASIIALIEDNKKY